jgi:hypothetical protein
MTNLGLYKVEKTIGPSCVITFLSLEIDTLEIVIEIPPPKLSEVQQKLIETLDQPIGRPLS